MEQEWFASTGEGEVYICGSNRDVRQGLELPVTSNGPILMHG